jgi:hypothetical protein
LALSLCRAGIEVTDEGDRHGPRGSVGLGLPPMAVAIDLVAELDLRVGEISESNVGPSQAAQLRNACTSERVDDEERPEWFACRGHRSSSERRK